MRTGPRRFGLDDGRFTLAAGSLLLLAFSLTRGLWEEGNYHPPWPVQVLLDFVRDLGIAAIVGGIVSLGIERISRKRFLDHISDEIKNIEKNVINAAYGKRYPQSYTNLIGDMLDRFDHFKYTLNVVIDIIVPDEPLTDANGEPQIYYIQTVSYFVHNMMDIPKPIQPRLFVDADVPGHPPEVLSWRIGGKTLSSEELRSVHEDAVSANDQIWYQFPEPVDMAPDERVFVLTKVRNVRFSRDTTTWCGIVPADSLRFTINHPRGYTAYAQPKSLGRPQDTPYVSDGERIVVEIFTPVLPYTTVEFGWRPAQTRQAAAADEVSGGTALPLGGSQPMSGSIQETQDASFSKDEGSEVDPPGPKRQWWRLI